MLWSTKNSDGNDNITAFGFHDINGKFTWKPNQRNTLSVNIYEGDDYSWTRQKKVNGQSSSNFQDGRNTYIWGNLLTSAAWKQVLGNKLLAAHSLSYTRYRLNKNSKFKGYDNAGIRQQYNEEYKSSVHDTSLRSSLKYSPWNSWTMEFGLQGSLLYFLPFYASTASTNTGPKTYIKTSEDALFWENRISFLKNSYITLGIRGVGYYNNGFTDFNLEPRIGFSIDIFNNQHICATYMQVKQYSHLIFGTQANIMRSEVWVPAGEGLLPSESEQISFGWQGSFVEAMFSSKLTFFYKTMSNLATFKDGYTSFRGNAHWQNLLATKGKGESKGAELVLKKNRGQITGYIGYTLSRTTRKYNELNNGKEFVFGFDRKHNLSISLLYKITPKLNFSMLWVYQTGLPYTPAIGSMLAPNGEGFSETLIYGERNGNRMRNYHRLDIGLQYCKIGGGGRRVEWSFSVYNLYCRQNPYRYFYNTQASEDYYHDDNKPIKLYQTSYFPIIPSISYKVYFDGSHAKRQREHSSIWTRVGNWLKYKE